MKTNILFSILLLAVVSITTAGAQPQSLKIMPDGVIIPKADHTAIVFPDNGQMVYDTVTRSVWFFNTMIWKEVGSDNLGNHLATTDLDMDDNSIKNVSTPVDDTDAANKAYVDLDTDPDPVNEIQLFSASTEGDTLYISDGNWLIVPGLSDANYIKDYDGNVYNEVDINGQIWLIENLSTTHYNDGTPIPKIEDAADWEDWGQSWNGTEYTDIYDAYSWYNNDSTTYNKFGILYNWGVVDATINGGKNACPVGYEVPSTVQLDALLVYAASLSPNVSGVTMKLPVGEFWNFSQVFPFGSRGNNATGFAAKGSGIREHVGTYNSNKIKSYIWSSDGGINQNVNAYRIEYDENYVDKFTNLTGGEGHTIRCIKSE